MCDELRNHDSVTRWNYLHERLHAIEQRIDALDMWHRWATGSTGHERTRGRR